MTQEQINYSCKYIKSSQLDTFHEDGHICLKSILPVSQVGFLESKTDEVIDHLEFQQSGMEKAVARLNGNREMIFIENIFRYSKPLSDFFFNGIVADIAKDILNTNNITLYRDQTYYKLSGGDATPWHQDGIFTPLDDVKFVTFWIPFHDITENHSPMSYIKSSHKACYLGSVFDRFHDFDSFKGLSESQGYTTVTYDSINLGDIIVHDKWTLHGSPKMAEGFSRKALVLMYATTPLSFSDEPLLSSCHSDLQREALDLRRWSISSYQNSIDTRKMYS